MADDFADYVKQQTRPDSAAAAPADPFADYVRQAMAEPQQQAQAVMAGNLGADADKAGRAARIGKQLGLPQALVEADFPQFEARAKAQTNSDIVAKNPVLANWIAANPEKARIAQDDLHNSASIDDAVKTLPNTSGSEWFDRRIKASLELERGFIGDLGKASGGIGLVGIHAANALDAATNLFGAGDHAIAEAWMEHMVKPGFALADRMELPAGASIEQKAWHTAGGLASMIATIAASGAGTVKTAIEGAATVPQIVTNLLAHGGASAAPVALSETINTGRKVFDQTQDMDQAAKAMEAQYGASTLGMMMPLSAPGKIFTRIAGGFASGVTTGEVSRSIMNAAMPESMQQPFSLEDVLFSGIVGSALGGAMGPRAEPSHYADIRKTYTDSIKAGQAEQVMSGIQSISELSQAAKLRERDPEAFKSLVQNMADDGKVDGLYIDAKEFANALHQSGVTDLAEKMPHVANDLPEAMATNGMVRIPLEDYATHIAGSKVDEAIQPHLKVDPAGMTLKEGQEFQKEQTSALTEQAAKIVEARQADKAFHASRQAVHDKVQQQLVDAGRSLDEAKVGAALHREMATVLGQHLGLTPEEAHAKHLGRIAGENFGKASLNQPITQGFDWKLGQRPGLFDKPDVQITRLGGGGLGADRESIKQAAQNKLKSIGKTGLPNDDTGWSLTVSAKDRDKLVKWPGNSDASLQIIGGIESLAKHAVLAESHTDSQHQNPDVQGIHRLYAPVEIDGVMHRAKLTVRDYNGKDSGEATKLHALEAVEIENAQPGNILPTEEGTPQQASQPTTGRTLSIAKLLENSTRHDGSDWSKLNQDGDAHRGAFDPDSRTIALLKDADLSTFVHESGHLFLDTYARIASQTDAPALIRQDMGKLLDWMGVESLEKWNAMSLDEQRPYHEKIAQGFEQYIMEGKAPSVELQPYFQRMKSWMLRVYQNIKALGHPIDDEVRGVFDRMLASEDAIKEAEQVRGYQNLFKTPEDAARYGISPEDYLKLQKLGQEATGDAIEDLQARSLKEMQWLSGAKSRALKALQKEAAGKRAEVKAEVTKEVMDSPVRQAEAYLNREGGIDPAPGEAVKAWETKRETQRAPIADQVKAEYLAKPEAAELKGIQKGQYLAKVKREMANETERRLLEWEKENPKPTRPPTNIDVIAEMFGFNSGKELRNAVSEAGNAKEVIDRLTDQRMLERHGELTDPQALERAAEAAIHNDARAHLMAAELKAVTKAKGPAKLMAEAAKQAAASTIGAKTIADLRPNQYTAAEAKAGLAAEKALAKDDVAQVAEQKRAQLLNNRLAKSAQEAVEAVRKGVAYLKRFDKESVTSKLPGDYVAQIQALRDQFDLRQTPRADFVKEKVNLILWAEGQRALGFEPQISEWLADYAQRTHYKELTVDQFKGLVDTIKSIEHTAKETQVATINGKRQAVRDFVDSELIPRLEERGEKFTKEQLLEPPKVQVDGVWQAATHWLATHLRMVDADLRPQDFKANKFDMHDISGPFRKAFFDRVFDRNYWKVDITKRVSDAAGKVGKELGPEWQKSLYDLVENKHLPDPDLGGSMMKITRGRMLGIARHVGNESNFAKLTKGYGWSTNQVWRFLHENMSAKDWQATQAHWDSFDPLWSETEAMVKRLSGTVPAKIVAREFDTKFGKMKGGYSPLDYDPIRSKLSVSKGEFGLEAGEKVSDNAKPYRATTTSNGSLINRAEGYTDRVNLDFHSAEARIRDTIHDLAYREALLDASKIINDAKFREKFMLTYGREEFQALTDWLKDIRDMNTTDPKNRGFEKAMQYSRQGLIMNGIAYRLSTVLKHGASAALKSLGYLGTGEGAKYFAARVYRMSTGHLQEEITWAKEKFPEIRTRMLQMDRDYKQGNASMYEAEGWKAKNDRFGHAMVAWSDALSAIPTAGAAYDLAKTSGVPKSMGGDGVPMSEAEAVKYANSVVRQAHGSALESTRSNFMQARGIKGLFGTIYGFMNNTYGQMRDLLDKAVAGGHFDNKPVLIARVLSSMILPAVWAAYLKNGGPNDNEGENPAWWGAKAIAGEVAGTVPFVRDAASLLEYGRGGTVAPMQLITDAINSGKDIAKEFEGDSSRLIQDLANAIGEWAHIGGLGQLGHILQYMRDEANGKKNPESTAQTIKEAVIGGAHK